MKKMLLVLSVLFVSMAFNVQAVEGHFSAQVRSVLATDNPVGERVRVVGIINLVDAEDIVLRASEGESIGINFSVQRPDGTLVYDQETDIVFPAGKAKVIIGKAKNGRIVAGYNAEKMTFSVRFVIRQDQLGSTVNSVSDQYEISGELELEAEGGLSYKGNAVVGGLFAL